MSLFVEVTERNESLPVDFNANEHNIELDFANNEQNISTDFASSEIHFPADFAASDHTIELDFKEGSGDAQNSEEIKKAVEDYFEENPITSAKLKIDETLKVNGAGALGVNTTSDIEKDNTLPITAAAVHTTVGNIAILLGTI